MHCSSHWWISKTNDAPDEPGREYYYNREAKEEIGEGAQIQAKGDCQARKEREGERGKRK